MMLLDEEGNSPLIKCDLEPPLYYNILLKQLYIGLLELFREMKVLLYLFIYSSLLQTWFLQVGLVEGVVVMIRKLNELVYCTISLLSCLS